jgi:signal transduction histidine kinase/pSer/pThr/pTyr-binding forkhead associated (FHA) protein
MPELVVRTGQDTGKRYLLDAAVVTVGRHSENAVPVHDDKASRRHLEIRKTATGHHLVDLGSGNGTRLNGRPVRSADLRAGDTIAVGDTLLEYVTDAPPTDRTRVVVSPAGEQPTAILRTVPEDEGSRILARPDAAASDWLRTRLSHLAVLYEATAAVSDILDVDDLLGRVVELVVRTTGADHGCAVEIDPETNELMPKAAHRRSAGGPDEFVVSRTVVDHVLTHRQGVLVADAAADERFRGGESVARHQLREVICVPMKGRHGTVGVLFLDTAGGAGATTFTDDHLHLAAAVAHQAGLAVEETRYYQAMLQSERLAAVGQTIAALSHHIKNIMQGVRFGSSMVKSGLAGGDRELLDKGWKLVEKNQRKIDDLILDMLSFSKDREPAAEPTDVNGVVGDVLDVVRGRAGDAGVSLVWEPDAELAAVSCDPDGVHRALLNVVSNAVDAVQGKADGRVTITTGRTADGAFAEVAVTDTGDGIPADKMAEIFKPFVSTKGAKGTGLGLPVSRKILREHGGDVTVSSEPGIGSRFVLRLPLTPRG